MITIVEQMYSHPYEIDHFAFFAQTQVISVDTCQTLTPSDLALKNAGQPFGEHAGQSGINSKTSVLIMTSQTLAAYPRPVIVLNFDARHRGTLYSACVDRSIRF